MVTAQDFSTLVGAERYIADMRTFDPTVGQEFLNTYGAKGPVFLVNSRGQPQYLLTDRKDSINLYDESGYGKPLPEEEIGENRLI